eukprot:jgi/Orpsp1_1/1182007/evm.model.c7180000079500.1
MGTFIDSNKGYEAFKSMYNSKYFVDKSNIIHEFNKLLDDSMNCVCITKPRRFGKSSIAALIISYYSKSRKDEFKKMFDTLEISGNIITYHNKLSAMSNNSNNKNTELEEHKNTQINISTIKISDNKINKNINNNRFSETSTIPVYEKNELEKKEYEKTQGKYHTIYIDFSEEIERYNEWDCMFSEKIFTVKERKYYLSFLKSLLKGKPYVTFTYMTGILPIAKSTSGTSLNNFMEFTMLKDTIYYKYFGLTEKEVRNLCKINGQLKYEDMENWYNGYKSYNGEKIFNTWSVMTALRNNSFDIYWGTEQKMNKIHMKMISENNLSQNEISSIDLKRNEMYSKMVVYGFLTYYQEEIFIPNNELREKFIELINEDNEFKVFKDLMTISKKLFEVTLAKKADEVCKILKNFHNDHASLKNYYNHITLSSTIYFAYYYARNKYYVMPEEEAEDGVADYIFQPKENNNDIAIIIELKVGTSAEDAIQQIYDRGYYSKLFKNGYKGDILLVGINISKVKKKEYYDIKKKKKKYTCIIEYFDEKKIKKTNNNTNDNDNVRKKRKRKQNQTNQLNQIEYQTEYKKKKN